MFFLSHIKSHVREMDFDVFLVEYFFQPSVEFPVCMPLFDRFIGGPRFDDNSGISKLVQA